MEPVSKEFETASLKQFYETYTTPKAQQAARAIDDQAERLFAITHDRYQAVVEKNQPSNNLDHKPRNMPTTTTVEQQKLQNIRAATTKFDRRMDRIEAKRDSCLEKIKQKHDMEIRVQQKLGGRTLSQEFRRHR